MSPATEGTVKVNSGREEDRSTLEEPEPKRAKPDNGGTGMELDSLRKIVTVKSWTQVVAGPTPEEEPQPNFWAWDDVSGETLDPDEVRRARQVEMDYVHSRKVWRRVPRALAARNGWKVIPGPEVGLGLFFWRRPCHDLCPRLHCDYFPQ